MELRRRLANNLGVALMQENDSSSIKASRAVDSISISAF